MKTQHIQGLALLILVPLAALALLGSPATGQLTGTAQKMRYDARIPISELPFVCDQPGSYFVTRDLAFWGGANHGIEILASNVTLDLNGFTLRNSAGTTARAVFASSIAEDVTVSNGTVVGWTRGVDLLYTKGARVIGIRAMDSGSGQYAGIYVGEQGLVKDCSAFRCFKGVHVEPGSRVLDTVVSDCDWGFWIDPDSSLSGCTALRSVRHGFYLADNTTATGCTAAESGENGFYLRGSGVLTDCTASENGYRGFYASSTELGGAWTLEGCVATQNTNDGFSLSLEGTLRGCRAVDNDGFGAHVTGSCQVVGNSFMRNAGGGLEVTGSENHIEGNTASFNGGPGFEISGDYNLVVKNRASVNSGNIFDQGTGNRIGSISNDPTTAGPWDNFSF